MRFILAHAEARRRAIQAVHDAPQGHVVKVSAPIRTLAQNDMIHPVVTTIAKLIDRPTDKESLRKLRYLLLEQWMHETDRPPQFERSFDGMRWVSVNKGTSDLEKPDCSEFIEWMLAEEAKLTT